VPCEPPKNKQKRHPTQPPRPDTPVHGQDLPPHRTTDSARRVTTLTHRYGKTEKIAAPSPRILTLSQWYSVTGKRPVTVIMSCHPHEQNRNRV